tara:strand:- start:47 stop:484 length:438 start_codon:yes stop_codon:yes gene_type:complete
MPKKITARTQNDGWEEPERRKVRKRRKPMTEEQRIAAAKRLAIAREKRFKKNPPKYKNIHPSVLAKPDDDTFSLINVRQWIKTQKGLLSKHRSDARMKVKGAIAKAASTEGYIRHCESYLRDGCWIDNFYGEYQEGRVEWETISG